MKLKKFFKDPSNCILKTVVIFLAVVLVFTGGTIAGFLKSPKIVLINNGGSESTSSTPAAPQSSADSLSSSNTQSTITEGTESEMSDADALALFNESANKIKTDAVKVTKNYEDRTHMEDYLQVPDVLTGLANELMAENFKDDTTPIVYETKEDIIANFQVPGEDWVSKLTIDDIEEIICVDKGTEYELYIKAKPSTNPENGVGVARGFDTITSSEVMESAPSMVKEFTTEYFDCIIRCKIDKETKNVTWINYSTPLILKLGVEFLGSRLNAQVGMKFEKDYNIEY